MIGKKVRVFWPVDESWYTGIVHEYDPATNEHLLRYEDGDAEWVRISNTAPNELPHQGPPPTAISPGESTLSTHQTPVQSVHGAPEAPPFPPQHMEPPNGPHHAYYAPPGHMPGHPYGAPMYVGNMYHHSQAHASAPPGASYGAGRESRGPAPETSEENPPPPPTLPQGHDAGSSGPNPGPAPLGKTGKKGPKAWSKHEDATLLKIVQGMSMPMRWSVVAQSLPDRTGKQCRERYVNHLNPRLKISDWNPVEDATVFHLYNTIGSHWSTMSKVIPGRTDNGIKNRFHNLRRQLEREDGHRLRLSNEKDFPEQIRLDKTRKFPKKLQGKADELWDIESGIGVLSAQSVIGGNTGGSNAAAKNFFGPFRDPTENELCVRCGFFIPSVQTGNEVCEKTGWCIACTRIPPHLSGNLLRECLNLRRCAEEDQHRKVVESWDDPPKQIIKTGQ